MIFGIDRIILFGFNTSLDLGPNFQLAATFRFDRMVFSFLLILLLVILIFFLLQIVSSLYFYFNFLRIHLNIGNKGILFFDSQGRLVRFNQNVHSMLNLPFSEQKGKSFKIIFRSLPQLKNHLEKLIINKQEINEEFTFSFQNKILKGHILGYPIKWLGHPIGFVLEIYDLSKDILSEREDLIHRLVRKMSHDIKTPLATIKFSVETLKYVIQNMDDAEVQEGLQNITQEVNRIQSITNNYSKIAQISRLRINIVDLQELCDELLSQFHPPDEVFIDTNISKEAQLITADADQLKVMFKELIENSLDAVGAKGKITISTFPAALRNKKNQTAICLNITDNGAGIPEGVKDKIFEPSFTTKTHGTGLGLVFVKQIVNNHQGEIIIDSEINKGTKIQIILPKELKISKGLLNGKKTSFIGG